VADVKVTVTRSAGTDGAVLVMVDTGFEPDGSDDSPGLRVLVNDQPVFAGREYLTAEEPREADRRTLEVDVAEVQYQRPSRDLFGTILATHGGDKAAAAVEVGRDLMRGDPAQHKAGYSRDSAVLAVARLYGLDQQDQEQVRERLPEEPDE
jgi:hypothetical protein